MIFGEINSFATTVERLRGFWKKRRLKDVTSIPRRFVELFEAHGVHRNQIPRFFGHEITLSDLAEDTSLLAKLTEPVLDAACALFGVRREWLDGRGEGPYIRHEFYKSPHNFARFIEGLKAANPDRQIDGYLLVSNDGRVRDQAAFLLAEEIGAVGDTIIYRYHICDDWVFSYWKSRAYLTACIAIAWKNEVFVKGRFAKARTLSTLTEKLDLPGPMLMRLVSRGRRWYAEDLALLPEKYLEGLDPEQNGFGLTAALNLWLELDNQGWMDPGLQKVVRPAFAAELAKYDVIEQPVQQIPSGP